MLVPQALTSLGLVMASRHARQSPRHLARPSSPQFRRVIGGFFRNRGSGVVEGPAAGLCGSSSPFPSSRCAPRGQHANSAGWTSIIVRLILKEIPALISALGFLGRLTRLLPSGQTDQLACPQVSSKCGFKNTKFGISGPSIGNGWTGPALCSVHRPADSGYRWRPDSGPGDSRKERGNSTKSTSRQPARSHVHRGHWAPGRFLSQTALLTYLTSARLSRGRDASDCGFCRCWRHLGMARTRE